jgi:catechol 2,3-dioxygenase-like lactoylglutathione lyase family enzyme
MPRPIEKYKLGLHHLAQPTMDPKATLEFYVDTMGASITHCISSKGWRPNHFDYIHMFLDLGRGHGEGPASYPDNIAMFYYFGVKDPARWPKMGTHHSFAVESIDELDRWQEWLVECGHEIIYRAKYEIMESLYLKDPNDRILEIAYQFRALNEIDADDAQLTAKALVLAAGEQADDISRMWEHKARLIEERDGDVDEVALICPRVEEFQPLVDAATKAGADVRERGNFVIAESPTGLDIECPDVSEGVWWGVGTGGVKGKITSMDNRRLVISAA